MENEEIFDKQTKIFEEKLNFSDDLSGLSQDEKKELKESILSLIKNKEIAETPILQYKIFRNLKESSSLFSKKRNK